MSHRPAGYEVDQCGVKYTSATRKAPKLNATVASGACTSEDILLTYNNAELTLLPIAKVD